MAVGFDSTCASDPQRSARHWQVFFRKKKV